MGAVMSCIQGIGDCIMTVINAIASVIMSIINGVVAVLAAIVRFLTCKSPLLLPLPPSFSHREKKYREKLTQNDEPSGGYCGRHSSGTRTRRSHV